MDRNNPTTKKHIAEAEARGCVLLGPGKNASYRTYRLACRHDQEMQVGAMRSGNFTCRKCNQANLQKQIEAEAAKQNCVVLGPGKNSLYRKYRLRCGHEQEIQFRYIPDGRFQCRECLKLKLFNEAELQNCELIGPGRSSSCRTYRLPCGHEREVQTGCMRHGKFICPVCFESRIKAVAEAQGCRLIRFGSGTRYCTFILPCGHEQTTSTYGLSNGYFRCKTCLEIRWREEAERQGCTILKIGRNSRYRIYRLPCGHEKEVSLGEMRRGRFSCKVCWEDKLHKEASEQNCTLLGPSDTSGLYRYRLACGHEREILPGNVRNASFGCPLCWENMVKAEAANQGCALIGRCDRDSYARYLLPCGHQQEISFTNMRVGRFACQTCGDYTYTQPSKVYLLLIKVGPEQWLKLGYSKNLDLRTTQYGLPPHAEVSLIADQSFETGLRALGFEKALHKKYKRRRLKSSAMLEFHSTGGAHECYPVEMVETLLAHFRNPE